jgi:hypothetical protein
VIALATGRAKSAQLPHVPQVAGVRLPVEGDMTDSDQSKRSIHTTQQQASRVTLIQL